MQGFEKSFKEMNTLKVFKLDCTIGLISYIKNGLGFFKTKIEKYFS